MCVCSSLPLGKCWKQVWHCQCSRSFRAICSIVERAKSSKHKRHEDEGSGSSSFSRWRGWTLETRVARLSDHATQPLLVAITPQTIASSHPKLSNNHSHAGFFSAEANWNSKCEYTYEGRTICISAEPFEEWSSNLLTGRVPSDNKPATATMSASI